ncbi:MULTISPECIES: PIN domain-containing protein [unclassified Adlercreutzia]|uniref:type II toxin-antitoxin system VapC family toxin n=1 Tax=unclassified Adlercreutzia TaxID=2636013 RepID=UPI0013EB4E2F|nr:MULTISPECIES: PIN domain-containing protein [unclassified Adlercreutzia]
MNAGEMSLLLDTNVWLDYFDPWRTFHEDAFALIDYAYVEGIGLAYFAGSLKDVYYLVGSIHKRRLRAAGKEVTGSEALACNEMAWGVVDAIRDLAIPLPLDLRTVWLARQQKTLFFDLEDGLVAAAAELAGIDFLVTNDVRLARTSTVKAYSSADMLTYLKLRAERGA